MLTGRHCRVPREQDGLPGIRNRQRRAEELFLVTLSAHGDSARSRAPRDTCHRAAESRERADPWAFRGKYHQSSII